MEINILHILIILFILYPFIRQLLDNLRGEEPEKAHKTAKRSTGSDPWEEPEKYDWGGDATKSTDQSERKSPWEDAFKELEEIFTEQTTGQQKQKTEPNPQRQRGQHERKTEPTRKHQEPVELSDNPYEADLPDFSHQEHIDHESLSIGASNPIYNEDLGSGGPRGNVTAAKQIQKTFRNPNSLRAAFIFKEVFDRPGAPPRRRRVTPYS